MITISGYLATRNIPRARENEMAIIHFMSQQDLTFGEFQEQYCLLVQDGTNMIQIISQKQAASAHKLQGDSAIHYEDDAPEPPDPLRYSFTGNWGSQDDPDLAKDYERFHISLIGAEVGEEENDPDQIDDILKSSGYKIILRKRTPLDDCD